MRIMTLTRAVLAAAVVSAIAAPAPANAQFGRLIKKAKAKVVGETDSSAAAADAESADAPAGSLHFGAPQFNADLIELTPAVLDRVMHGMSVEVSMLKKNGAKGKKLSDDVEAANKEYEQLASQHPDEERQAWEESNSKIDECIGTALDKLREQREGEAQARIMSDPSVRQKMMNINQKAAAAAQSGDTVTTKKLMAEMEALMYPFAKEDSATARKECGTPSAKPAWLVRQEELNERRSDLASQLRELDGQARDTAVYATGQGGEGGRASGGGQGGQASQGGLGGQHADGRLTKKQYSLALERLVGWAYATAPGAKGGASYARMARYSPTELDAMKAKEPELRALAKELGELHVWQ